MSKDKTDNLAPSISCILSANLFAKGNPLVSMPTKIISSIPLFFSIISLAILVIALPIAFSSKITALVFKILTYLFLFSNNLIILKNSSGNSDSISIYSPVLG